MTTATDVLVQKDVPDDLVKAIPVYAMTAGNALVFLGEVLADGAETGFRQAAPSAVRKIVLDPKQTILRAPKQSPNDISHDIFNDREVRAERADFRRRRGHAIAGRLSGK